MRSRAEITREVEDRNKFRSENGLPLVSVPQEVEKIYEAALHQDFVDWSNAYPLRGRIRADVLEECRKERHDPTWVPRSYYNGGADYSGRVEDRLREIWRAERKQ